jgi:hypothetical protein
MKNNSLKYIQDILNNYAKKLNTKYDNITMKYDEAN